MENQSEEDKVLKKIGRKIAKEDKIYYIASFKNLIELVENEDNELEFMIYSPETKNCDFVSKVEIEGKVYSPPPLKSLPQNLLFPRKKEVLGYLKKFNGIYNNISNRSDRLTIGDDIDDLENVEDIVILYKDLIKYYKKRAELPDERLYDIIALWTFHTYAIEKADFSPIIYFLGLPEKGKSRILKSMIYASRRGLRKISMTDAQILRDCTHLEATIALDMMNLWKKVELAGSEDVFLNRPERGIDVSRVNRPEQGAFKDTDYYTVFGATIFATNEIIHEILDTRALPIIMHQSKKEYSQKVKAEDGLVFRERLTAWRALIYDKKFPDVPRIAKARLGDIIDPLYQLVRVIIPKKEKDFIDIIHEIENKRIKEKADSFSGQIIQAVWGCRELVEGGYLKSQLVANEFNKDKKEREQISSRRILGKLKTMGFDTSIVHGGNAAIFWNLDLIDSLKIEYGIENGISSPNPQTSKSSTSSPFLDDLGI